MAAGRPTIRTKDDKKINVHLHSSIVAKLRKLMRINGQKELKPYIEEVIMQHVMESEDEGII